MKQVIDKVGENSEIEPPQVLKKKEIMKALNEMVAFMWHGGMEIKLEDGKITYFKTWRGIKF